MDQEYVDIMTMVDGEMQEARDADMRAKHAAGENAMDGDIQKMFDDFRFASVRSCCPSLKFCS